MMNATQERIFRAVSATLLVLFVFASTVVAEPDTIPDGYSVETIEVPDHITLEVGGLEFAQDGVLYITTRYGEVWMYDDGNWKKFADGLQHALGIELEDGGKRAFVAQKPELTELVDTDGDRVAEVYRTVTDAWGYSGNYHEFAFGPVRDREGNFYVTLNLSHSKVGDVRGSVMSREIRDRGTLVQITPNGTMRTYAYGLRSPAGLSISPGGELFVAGNQGDWMPTSPLLHVEKGKFYGHPASLADHPKFKGRNLDKVPVKEFKKLRERPVLWFPYDLANSPGTPVYDTKKQDFGPFDGQMFVGDQTKSNIMRVAVEKVKGQYQGVVFNFIDHLQCGIVRATFGPDNESLWVGQTNRGWGSSGSAPYGLQRIAYDGETVPYSIRTIKLSKQGFVARFTHPVDRKAAANPDNYDVTHWRYKYHSNYGSAPTDKTDVKVQSVDVSSDGQRIRLNLPELVTGRVYKIQLDIPSADGTKLTNNTGWYTVNKKK